MISSIMSSSNRYLQVYSNGRPYINSRVDAGQMRWNTSMNRLEVYDGSAWLQMDQPATVDLTPDAIAALDWVRKQMMLEGEVATLAKTHPTVAAAVEEVSRADEALRIVISLVKDHNSTAKGTK